LFSVKLNSEVVLTAHKLIAGHTIRLHNDFVPERETHRLLIQFNREWQDENGGFLLFFNSPAPEDINRIIRPVHNSSVGFAISPKSNHAVSTVNNGERYTLVYSFYAADIAD
jgi:Rps23 Pro-64 3,4-dihydroxylase Tpa1-like proline 4-hydroxylase